MHLGGVVAIYAQGYRVIRRVRGAFPQLAARSAGNQLVDDGRSAFPEELTARKQWCFGESSPMEGPLRRSLIVRWPEGGSDNRRRGVHSGIQSCPERNEATTEALGSSSSVDDPYCELIWTGAVHERKSRSVAERLWTVSVDLPAASVWLRSAYSVQTVLLGKVGLLCANAPTDPNGNKAQIGVFDRAILPP